MGSIFKNIADLKCFTTCFCYHCLAENLNYERFSLRDINTFLNLFELSETCKLKYYKIIIKKKNFLELLTSNMQCDFFIKKESGFSGKFLLY